MANISDSAVICNKCSHICYKKRKITSASTIQSHVSSSLDDYHPYLKVARQQSLDRSPPSVTLAIPSTSNSHSYCFVCKKPGPKLIVAPTYARFRAYIQSEIFVQSGSVVPFILKMDFCRKTPWKKSRPQKVLAT